jgi:hypothetical protein
MTEPPPVPSDLEPLLSRMDAFRSQPDTLQRLAETVVARQDARAVQPKRRPLRPPPAAPSATVLRVMQDRRALAALLRMPGALAAMTGLLSEMVERDREAAEREARAEARAEAAEVRERAADLRAERGERRERIMLVLTGAAVLLALPSLARLAGWLSDLVRLIF